MLSATVFNALTAANECVLPRGSAILWNMNYEALVDELVSTIRLGYEAEGENPAFEFHLPTGDELDWLAAWIVSEGWQREPGWASRTRE